MSLPTPYYSEDNITLYCGDAIELLPDLPEFDLVLTDPPYGVEHPCSFNSRKRSRLARCNDYAQVHGDNKPFDPEPWINQPAILWGANHYASRLPDSDGWLVWDKELPDTLDQSTCELAWSNVVKGCRRFRFLWHGMIRGGEPTALVHPTQKPVELMRWCLSFPWTKGFETVLDPYCGSGPVLRACMDLGKRAVGIEINEDYCKIAVERLRQRVLITA